MDLILASGSPRRRELLERAGFRFEILPADVDEGLEPGISPADAVEYLSKIKAEAVWKDHPEDVVIGADTVVACDGMILGKPADRADALRMLQMLNGRSHSVFTGVTVMDRGSAVTFSEETVVVFKRASEAELQAYVDTGEPMDKAGAYAIQGIGKFLVDAYRGDYDNVVGLPVARLADLLGNFGILPSCH